jgi:hypothetical protein
MFTIHGSGMKVDYYLISASRRAHRLKPGRPYVFGREAGVEIPVQDALASRRHAELRWREDDGWDLVDLASRNGVMVNGVRIDATKPRKLDDADQVQIGGQVFRYHMLPPGGDPASLSEQAPQISNVETMGPGFSLSELASQGAAFTGELSDGVLVMLQFLLGTKKTGRLDFIGAKMIGSVWTAKGTPIHSTYGGEEGIDALVAWAVNPAPRFAFHADAAPDHFSIEGSANGILMEVARLMDEMKRA